MSGYTDRGRSWAYEKEGRGGGLKHFLGWRQISRNLLKVEPGQKF